MAVFFSSCQECTCITRQFLSHKSTMKFKSAIELLFRSQLPLIYSLNSGLIQGMWVFWADK